MSSMQQSDYSPITVRSTVRSQSDHSPIIYFTSNLRCWQEKKIPFQICKFFSGEWCEMVVKHMIGLWSDCDRTVDRTVIWLWSDCQWIRPPQQAETDRQLGWRFPISICIYIHQLDFVQVSCLVREGASSFRSTFSSVHCEGQAMCEWSGIDSLSQA